MVVHDFVSFFVRHVLGWRVGPRGILSARSTSNGSITVLHRARDGCSGNTVERRIAQLRWQEGAYQLFWKKGNGRWTAYYDKHGDLTLGSLAECLEEISRDPFGCYWV